MSCMEYVHELYGVCTGVVWSMYMSCKEYVHELYGVVYRSCMEYT